MLLPAVPAVVADTIRKLLPMVQLELTPTESPLPARLIASLRLEASWVVEAAAEPDQYGKFAPVVNPSEPLARLPDVQVKLLALELSEMLLPPVPAVLAATITWLVEAPLPPVPCVKVTNSVLQPANPAADARFAAAVDVVELLM